MHLQVTMRGLGNINPITGCPLTAALTAFGGKWKLIIVYWLAGRAMHFAELRRHIDGISPKVLSQQLRELARDGIVERTRSGKVPAPVIYALTEYGRSLLPLLEMVRQWGNGHLVRSARLKSSKDRSAIRTLTVTGNRHRCMRAHRLLQLAPLRRVFNLDT